LIVADRAVFLDRDGVLDHPVVEGDRERPPWRVAELEVVRGASAAMDALRAAGYRRVVVTNQPDVARGDVSLEAVEEVNAALRRSLDLDAVYVCAHDARDRCACRKPRPGMLFAAATDLDLDLSSSWLIGDRWVDIAAAAAAGVRSVLVEHERSWDATSAGSPPVDLRPTLRAQDVGEAVEMILASSPDHT
jgi:D-glycero-D-manno-heptose 1,7-bisphosphate phosphatase